jgi:predicted permease
LNNFYEPEYIQQYLLSAGGGICAVFAFSLIAALLTIKYLKGRLITFMLVTWGLFLVFFVTFYGLNYLMRKFWGLEATWGSRAIDIVSLCIAVGLMCVFALGCKIMIPEGPSWLQAELDSLSEDQLTPMDVKRREHMSRRK